MKEVSVLARVEALLNLLAALGVKECSGLGLRMMPVAGKTLGPDGKPTVVAQGAALTLMFSPAPLDAVNEAALQKAKKRLETLGLALPGADETKMAQKKVQVPMLRVVTNP